MVAQTDEFTLEDAKWWFDKKKSIAVVGFSKNPMKAAHSVPMYMLRSGFRIIPVNPYHDRIGQLKCYHHLGDIPFPVEIVNVFRPSYELAEVVEQALAVGVKGVWAQLGIHDAKARTKAKEKNIQYVEDRCIKVEYQRWAPLLEKEGR